MKYISRHDFQLFLSTAVEIDPDLIEIGHKWFGLPRPEEEPRLRIHIADGLKFPYEEQKRLAQDNGDYFLILVLISCRHWQH